jgi:tetratricopeptide (TPR) repeat protein
MAARVKHPHVAHVYEVGTHAGHPFYALEYVGGGTLLARLRRQPFPPREAAALVRALAEAIQAAHSQGIRHRDLKPANVLLEADGTPKITDFGLAKHMGLESGLTETGQALGTPQYMPPEQVRGDKAALGPTADVYSLGAILFECLAGAPPFAGGAPDEVMKRVEAEPPALPPAVARRVPRDLASITLKCLAKDPAGRYPSAAALAEDLSRFLEDRPTRARPAGRWERGWRWCRRNPALAGLIAAVLLGLAGTSGGLAWALREKDRAAEQARLATEVSAFLQRDLLGLTGIRAQRLGQLPGRTDLKARDLLDRAAATLAAGERFRDQPLVEAELRATVGGAYLDVGEPARALPHLERAAALFLAVLGPDHPDTLANQSFLAEGYRATGRAAEAVLILEAALGRWRALGAQDRMDALDCLNNLGLALHSAGRLDRALAVFEEVWGRLTAQLGPDDPHTLLTQTNLAMALVDAGRRDRGLDLLEGGLQRQRAILGPTHPDTLGTQSNLAITWQAAGQFDRALPLLEDVVRHQQSALGATHRDTLLAMANLADGYRAAGRLHQALPLLETAARHQEAVLGPNHPDTLTTLNNLAVDYQAVGQFDRALPLFERVCQGRRDRLGPDHAHTLLTQANLAECYRTAGRLDQAIPLFEEVLARQQAALGPNHPDALTTLNNLAVACQSANQLDRAIRLFEHAYEGRREALGPDHAHTLLTQANLAEGYRVAGKLDRAIPTNRQALQGLLAARGPDHPDALTAMNNLAVALQSHQELGEAVRLLETALAGRQKVLGPDHPHTLLTQANLANAYRAAGRVAEAIPLLEGVRRQGGKQPGFAWVGPELLELYLLTGRADEGRAMLPEALAAARALPSGSPQRAGALALLGLYGLRLGAFTEAEPVLRECLTIREQAQPAAWSTANARSLLGGALLGQGKHAEAEPLLVKGWEGLKAAESTIPPQGRGNLVPALARLVRLYEATGREEAAAPYRGELGRRLAGEMQRDLAWPLLWGWPR